MSSDRELPAGFVVDEQIKAAMLAYTLENKLTCALAHSLAREYQVSPAVIGHTADAMHIRLSQCQLGLFGYPGKQGWHATNVANLPEPAAFVSALQEETSNNQTIDCLSLWNLAATYHVARMQAGYLADKLGIRIIHCQIGAF